jgi:hypothetical protein
MKQILLIFLSTLAFTAVSQNDTTKIYVINNTNEFVEIKGGGYTTYSFFYRDLKFLKETRELKFTNKTKVTEFFDKAEKVLATDSGIITADYNLYRNKLSKNVLRLQNKDGGYVLLSRETLETMRSEFNKH